VQGCSSSGNGSNSFSSKDLLFGGAIVAAAGLGIAVVRWGAALVSKNI